MSSYTATVLCVIKHILITRKISNIQNTILFIAYNFDKDINYTQLFSFYTNAEILNLIDNNAHYSCNYYINNRNVKFTLIFFCIRNGHYKLLDYLLHYIDMYNLPIIIDVEHTINQINETLNPSNNYMKLIAENEKKIIYLNSLRHAWIMACII